MQNSAALSVDALENLTDLYIRVSTTEQAEEGYSIGEQEARGRAYCEAYGLAIHAVHIDAGYSGATLNRPGIQEVIKDVRAGRCKKVVVWKLDRLSRSQKDTLILLEDVLLKNGCGFVSIMESFDTSTPFGRCIVGILAAFAQMERENIKARMLMGKQAGLREGNFYSGNTPVGYRYERQANGKRGLTVDPYSSQIVKDMYRLYNSGWSLCDIGAYVQKNYGLYPGRARHEAGAACSKVMQNCLYMGKVRYKGEIYNGKHEAIISPEDWKQANDRLAKNRTETHRLYPNGKGLLCGFLFCGCCGARMAVRGWGWGDKRTDKYICYSVSNASGRMSKSSHCENRKKCYEVKELDDIVIEEIKKLSLDPAAVDALIEKNREDPSPDLGMYEERLADVERQMKRLLTLYQTGAVELDEISGRLAALKKERAAVSENISRLTAGASQKLPKAEAAAALSSFAAVVESGDPAVLFSLVHSLIEKVVVLNEEITVCWAFC